MTQRKKLKLVKVTKPAIAALRLNSTKKGGGFSGEHRANDHVNLSRKLRRKSRRVHVHVTTLDWMNRTSGRKGCGF